MLKKTKKIMDLYNKENKEKLFQRERLTLHM